jgi:hypothetical protein
MEIVWQISSEDVKRLQRFVEDNSTGQMVKARKSMNLGTAKTPLTRGRFWHALIGCLLTTQQKSGPKSAVARLLLERPFPLAYDVCCREHGLDAFVTKTLTKFGGIRRTTRIGKEAAANLSKLEAGLWEEALGRVNSLLPNASQEQEFEVAEFLDDLLIGLGPKQSRNLLIGVGFGRYEIPIDSRLTKWLNEFGFPVKLSSTALADRHYYRCV